MSFQSLCSDFNRERDLIVGRDVDETVESKLNTEVGRKELYKRLELKQDPYLLKLPSPQNTAIIVPSASIDDCTNKVKVLVDHLHLCKNEKCALRSALILNKYITSQ